MWLNTPRKEYLTMKISEILKENGVGIVNAQNSTKDVGPSTTRKNLKAFNLVEGPSLESICFCPFVCNGASCWYSPFSFYRPDIA